MLVPCERYDLSAGRTQDTAQDTVYRTAHRASKSSIIVPESRFVNFERFYAFLLDEEFKEIFRSIGRMSC